MWEICCVFEWERENIENGGIWYNNKQNVLWLKCEEEKR
jgi:hypothetical protein